MAAQFESWNAYYKFANTVTNGRRHIFDTAVDHFLTAVGDTLHSRELTIPIGTMLHRAQISHDIRTEIGWDQDGQEEVPIADFAMPCSEERLKPLYDRAKEGRVNPKGRPVFYAATDDTTAIAEVRPWKGAYVTVGCFTTNVALRLVDCTRHSAGPRRQSKVQFALADLMNGDPRLREESVWIAIEEAFSKPVMPSDERADYLPTQIVTEVFMDRGYDGVKFKSSVAEGSNIVIFDPNHVSLFEASVAIVDRVRFDFTIGGYDGIEIE